MIATVLLLARSYDDWRRERTCTRKRRLTQAEAIRQAREMREHAPQVRAYRCAYCGWHHVGGTRGFEERDPNEWTKPEE